MPKSFFIRDLQATLKVRDVWYTSDVWFHSQGIVPKLVKAQAVILGTEFHYDTNKFWSPSKIKDTFTASKHRS